MARRASESRFFENRLREYSTRNEDNVLRDGTLTPQVLNEIHQLGSQFMAEWQQKSASGHGLEGECVYTGIGGAALLHYFLFMKNKDPTALDKAVAAVNVCLPHLKFKDPSFLCGDAGVLAVGAAAYCKSGNLEMADKLYKQLESFSGIVLSPDSKVPDELLYGRAGFLYSLLFLKKECPGEITVSDALIRETCGAIIKSGENWSARIRFPAPLYYEWYSEAYLGAAHGFAGILFMLLNAVSYLNAEDLEKKVRVTIDHLRNSRFPSGNFPAAIGDRSDNLVHWCHGAPGFVFLFAKAFQVFGDYKYRDAAYEAAVNVWERGLLKKGYGLCHGVAGNAYALLYMFQVLGDKAFLHRAAEFAKFCGTRGKLPVNVPDTPMSMFEGLGGTIYFLNDFLDPMNAKFPGFAL